MRNTKSGNTLVTVMVASVIGGIVLSAIVNGVRGAQKGARAVGQNLELEGALQLGRLVLSNNESCTASLQQSNLINTPGPAIKNKPLQIYAAPPNPGGQPTLMLADKDRSTTASDQGNLTISSLRFSSDNPVATVGGYLVALEIKGEKKAQSAGAPVIGGKIMMKISTNASNKITGCSLTGIPSQLECVTGYYTKATNSEGMSDGGPNGLTDADFKDVFEKESTASPAVGAKVQTIQGTVPPETWGLSCKAGWRATSCNIANQNSLRKVDPGQLDSVARFANSNMERFDLDVNKIDLGCYADNEEAESKASIYTTCCRVGP